MNRKQFRNSNHEMPTEPGRYQWKMSQGVYIPVTWDGEHWHAKNGDDLGTAVIFWR